MYRYFVLFLGLAIVISGAALGFSRAPERATAEAAAAKLPDLTVTKVTAVPGKRGVRIKYTVKNIGKAPAKASKAKVHVANENIDVTQVTPSLMPGESYSTSLDYAVAKGKRMQINVSADYGNEIRESNEQNNDNTINFSVGF